LRGSSATRLSESDRYGRQHELKSKAAALEAEAESIRHELAELEEADRDADERERRNYGDDGYDGNWSKGKYKKEDSDDDGFGY
jgi:hypothetical protein